MVIGIDIGGTTVKVGIFDDGKLIKKFEVPTGRITDGEEIIKNIIREIKLELKKSNVDDLAVKGVGIGVPGGVINETFVPLCVNLNIKELDIGKIFKSEFENAIVKVNNDANVAALGEISFGIAKDFNDAIMITLGTGVGGGVIINNQILQGNLGLSGEVGHMVVDRDEQYPCSCGKYGCLEQYCSARGVVALAKRIYNEYVNTNLNILDFECRDVFELAKTGDELCNIVVDKFVDILAFSLANLASVLDTECFILGGGVSKSADFFKDKLIDKFNKYLLVGQKNKIKILIAKLGNDAGIYGAARMVVD